MYFNDSTKIVVSPDGTVFQYSERRRKEKGSTSSEHSIQTHSVNRYPAELQKKVTLLRHFRNYLVDQQKEGAFWCLSFPSRFVIDLITILWYKQVLLEATMGAQQEDERI